MHSKLLVVSVLLASGSGWADTKFRRQQNVKIDVKLSDKVKPIQPKPASKGGFRPELTADTVLSIESQVSGIRAEQEQGLAELISQTPDTEVEEKAQYYFQLGELYAKQQRLYRLKAAEAAIAVDRAKTPQQKQRAQAAANKAADITKQYLLKAVKTYKALTDNEAFRNYPKMDMALFYYGYTLQGGNYFKEARSVFDTLLKNYPNSKYVPEAHLAFAEYYFQAGQLDDAEARYRMVLKFPKASPYWYASYMMGWIHLNRKRFKEALDTFFKVANATKNNKKQAVLNRAAKKDFVRAYSEVGTVDQAFNAFRRVDQGYAFDMLQLLADLYLEQGKSDKAIYTYRDLMKRAPKNKNVCLWQYNVAHASLSVPGATNADKVTEIENLVRLYGALRPTKVLPAVEAQECHDNAAAMSGELARAYHSESAKTRNPETLAYADKLYRVYLDVFPDAADYAQTEYFYAELLWTRAEMEKNARLQTELWENAAVAFTDVVKTRKVEPKLIKESAYASVLAWKNALNVDPRVKQQVADEDPQQADKEVAKQEIPAREKKMLAAFDIYINYIKDPKDDELVGMKFMKANIYRRYGHYEEAIPIFQDIIDHHRQHETAEYSANLLLDTYNRQKRYDDLVALADKLENDKKFLEGKEDLQARLLQIKSKSLRDKAEAMRTKAKDSKDYAQYVACGLAYQEIYNRNPEDPSNDEVLYNAGVCFEEGKSIGAAIGMYNTLQKYYPKSKTTARAVARLGKAYGDIAYYDRAADKLEEYATKYAGEKDAHDALNDAVLYRKGLGDDDKAIKNTKDYIRLFGRANPQNAADASFSLTSIYEKRGDKDAIVKHLREYIRAFGERGGADKLVVANAKIGQVLFEQSCPVKQTDGTCVKITRERATASRQTKVRRGKQAGYVAPLQCGAESKIKLTVIPRDKRKLRDAMAAFKAAERHFERKGGKTGGDEAAAKHYYAIAKFAAADVEFEKFLDIKFPANLNFGDGSPGQKALKDRAQKRFNEWLEGKTKASVGVANRYAKVLEIKDAANSIAAAARIGQVSQDFSDQLFTAEIPKDVRSSQIIDGYDLAQDKVDAYCDALNTAAEPLAARSLEAFGICLAKSTELGWFSDWSKLCERELGQIRPEEFPTASEIRGNSDKVAPVIAVEPPAKVD